MYLSRFLTLFTACVAQTSSSPNGPIITAPGGISTNISAFNLTLPSLPIRQGSYNVPGTSTYLVYALDQSQPLPSYDLSIAISQASDHFKTYVSTGFGNVVLLPSDDPYLNVLEYIHLDMRSLGAGGLTYQVAADAMWGFQLLTTDHKRRCSTFFNVDVGGTESRRVGSGHMGSAAVKDISR